MTSDGGSSPEIQRRRLLAEALAHEAHRDWQASRAVLERASKLFPHDLQIALRVAAVTSRCGNLKAAIAALDDLLSWSPDYEKAVSLRRSLAARQAAAAAREEARSARQARQAIRAWNIPLAQTCADALSDETEKDLTLCEIAYLRGDLAAATRHIERVLATGPYSCEAYHLASQILGAKRASHLVGSLAQAPVTGLSDADALALLQMLYFDLKWDRVLNVVAQLKKTAERSPAFIAHAEAWEFRILQLRGQHEVVVRRTQVAADDRTISRYAATYRTRSMLELGRIAEAQIAFGLAYPEGAALSFNPIDFHLAIHATGPAAAYARYARSPTSTALAAAFPDSFTTDPSRLRNSLRPDSAQSVDVEWPSASKRANASICSEPAPEDFPGSGLGDAARSRGGSRGAEDDCIFVAEGGVGDEIRHAAIYALLARSYPGATITCDPRLLALMQRSFPGLRFRPVMRWRPETRFGMYATRANVRGNMMCAQVLDEETSKIIEQASAFSSVAAAIGFVFRSDDAFLAPHHGYVMASRSHVIAARELLASARRDGKKLVGLCWRSTLRDPARDSHYTDIGQWDEVLPNQNVRFVNLQAHCSDEELKTIRSLGGNLVTVPEIDVFNDFESTAALMLALDCVVAPATTTIELAGALGVRSYFLAHGFETAWRRKPNGRDAWHESVEVLTPPTHGDKAGMLRRLDARLRAL